MSPADAPSAARPQSAKTTTVSAQPGAAPRPRWLAGAGPGAVLVALLALLAAGEFSGAFAPLTGFADPGALVRWGLPVVTVLVELSLAVSFASLVLAATVLRPGAQFRHAMGVAGAATVVWAVCCLGQLVLRYADIAGVAPTDPTFGNQLGTFVTTITLGRNYLFVLVVAVLSSAFAFAARRPTGALWTAALVGVAIAAQANTGHAAGAASHELAISSMFLHLGGAALWIGGLATLAVVRLCGELAGGALPNALRRYSSVAGWCYIAVAVSGVVNARIRLGSWSDLTTDYGILVLGKLTLLVVLGLFGFAHRELVIRRLASGLGRRDALGGAGPAAARGVRPAAVRDAGPAAVRGGRLFWRLVCVELLVMGAVSGVAVALASTAPPVPQTPYVNPTPAERVTGHALPPEPTLARWFTEFRWDILFGFLAVAGLVVYLRWARRLARRGDRWPVGRTISWCCGMVLFFWVTCGGPAMYGHVLFSAHMIEHMILATIVPIFLALAAPITLLARAIPARTDGSRGPREWILAIIRSKWGRFFANPIVAAINFAASMVVFYFTPLFGLALTTYVGHVAMVVHFTLAGYMFVNAVVGIDPGPHRLGYPQRLLLLFATMAFHAFFGITVMSGTSLLVPEWFGLLGRPWGAPALADQQTGGAIAWGIGELPTLALAIVVAVGWTRSDEREARRRDRRVDREGDIELDEYNEMLARLADQDGPHEHRP